jgi:hypothetical protein
MDEHTLERSHENELYFSWDDGMLEKLSNKTMEKYLPGKLSYLVVRCKLFTQNSITPKLHYSDF